MQGAADERKALPAVNMESLHSNKVDRMFSPAEGRYMRLNT